MALPAPSVRLGINPLTWTNDDLPDLGAHIPLEVCLRQAKEAGFEGVELGNKFPRRPEVLGPLLQRHGLALVSGWYSTHLLERPPEVEADHMAPHLHLLGELGAKVAIVAETTGAVHGDIRSPLSKRPVLTGGAWALFARRLTRLGALLAERGMILAYHHHMGTVIQTEAEIDRLLDLCGPEVRLLLDTGHLAFAGGRPAVVAHRHARRIAHVHAKDVRGHVLARALDRDAPFLQAVLDGVFTVPGDGWVDYHAVMSALGQGGFRGWVVVEAEQDPARAHPATFARMGHRNARAFLRGAGLLE